MKRCKLLNHSFAATCDIFRWCACLNEEFSLQVHQCIQCYFFRVMQPPFGQFNDVQCTWQAEKEAELGLPARA